MTEETVQIHVSVSPETKQRFRVAAAERGVSMSDLGREIIKDWIETQAAVAES